MPFPKDATTQVTPKCIQIIEELGACVVHHNQVAVDFPDPGGPWMNEELLFVSELYKVTLEARL
jgi:hypothetical protein